MQHQIADVLPFCHIKSLSSQKTLLRNHCYKIVASHFYLPGIENGQAEALAESWRKNVTRAIQTLRRPGFKNIVTGVSAGALLVALCVPALAADDDTKAEFGS